MMDLRHVDVRDTDALASEFDLSVARAGVADRLRLPDLLAGSDTRCVLVGSCELSLCCPRSRPTTNPTCPEKPSGNPRQTTTTQPRPAGRASQEVSARRVAMRLMPVFTARRRRRRRTTGSRRPGTARRSTSTTSGYVDCYPTLPSGRNTRARSILDQPWLVSPCLEKLAIYALLYALAVGSLTPAGDLW